MNSIGRLFRVEIFGSSHGKELGAIIDGCPPGIDLSTECFLQDVLRRSPVNKIGATPRHESDIPEIVSGVYLGKTSGAPILIKFSNTNPISNDYSESNLLRPGHADFTANKKYSGFNDPRGGGFFSGRMTLAITAAGVIAKKICRGIVFDAKLISAGQAEKEEDFESEIENAASNGNSIGGMISCSIKNIPVGLGEPFFMGLESAISAAVFSIPGAKAIEFGSGFDSAYMSGSRFNDIILNDQGKTKTNNAGGINGGISNGNDITFKTAFRPASSIFIPQQTIDLNTGKPAELHIKGRHDTFYVSRCPVIVESAAACVIADMMLINKAYKNC